MSAFDPTLITAKPSDGSAPDPDAGCQSIITYMTGMINWTSAGTLKIYSSTQLADNLIDTVTLTDNTTATIGARGGPPVWKSRLGERLVVVFTSDLTMATTGAATTIEGHSIDWANRNFVKGYTLSNAAG